MTNIFGMRCPTCGDESEIDILAEVWIRVCEDGTDVDASSDGNHYFTPRSTAACACGHSGTVAGFTPED